MLFLLTFFKENPTPKSSETSKLKAPKMELNQANGGQELIKSSQRAFMDIEESENPLLGNKKSLNSVIGYLEKMKEQVQGVKMPALLQRQLENVKANML